MWSFLKNKHDFSLDSPYCAKLVSYDGTATFADISSPSSQYTLRALTDIQEISVDALEVYYDGSFRISAKPADIG